MKRMGDPLKRLSMNSLSHGQHGGEDQKRDTEGECSARKNGLR
jgi:hypothetical protein